MNEVLTISDFTHAPRLGFKGRGTMEAMEKRRIALQPEANRAFVQKDGGLCLVLARSEVILLGHPDSDGTALAKLEADWRIEDLERSYPVPRRDGGCWFLIAGAQAPVMFSKICGVDLRPHKFPDLQIAQTSIARLNGIICRDDRFGAQAFHLLADIASKDYLSDCLIDAMAEFGGEMVDRPPGLKAA
jgi:sarcosine oxidase, subunit gamma